MLVSMTIHLPPLICGAHPTSGVGNGVGNGPTAAGAGTGPTTGVGTGPTTGVGTGPTTGVGTSPTPVVSASEQDASCLAGVFVSP